MHLVLVTMNSITIRSATVANLSLLPARAYSISSINSFSSVGVKSVAKAKSADEGGGYWVSSGTNSMFPS